MKKDCAGKYDILSKLQLNFLNKMLSIKFSVLKILFNVYFAQQTVSGVT